ncbi:MAG: TatD family deoxyribonuclease [Acidobacteria bacterium]|nr:TatD family deoxyribonuclease [Acidobacteriota bacterium]
MTDSHCHIAGKEFIADLDAVVERARAAGVQRALVILAAEDDAEIARVPTVLATWPECRFAVGVHPHHAHLFAGNPQGAAAAVAARLDALPLALAVGEIGLDYHYDFSPRDVQHAVFRAQLQLARSRDLPVVIHTREAEDDTLRILGEEGGAQLRGVFHCFTGDSAAAARALATGFYLSVPGVVSFPKAEPLRLALAQVPADRLLVETDSPYLAPAPFRGKRNEPAHVATVVALVAAARGVTPEVIVADTDRNFDALFQP